MGRSSNVVGISGSGNRANVDEEGHLSTHSRSHSACFTKDYDDAQAATAIITPTSGKKLKVISAYVSTKTETTDVTLEFATSEKIIFKLYTGKKQAQAGNEICGEGATDEALSLTCGDGTFVAISYDEVD